MGSEMCIRDRPRGMPVRRAPASRADHQEGAMMTPVNSSRQRVTRRKALAAGGAGLAAVLLPEAVRGQQGTRSETDLRAILSRMTLADKVGQLLMAYLEPRALEEKIDRYRCGSLLVWGNLPGVDVLGLCDLTTGRSRCRCSEGAVSYTHLTLPTIYSV